MVMSGYAQDVTGNFEGRILDSTGEPIVSANVIVSGKNLQGVRGAATDERGYFRVIALPPGRCTVQISHIGFQKLNFKNVIIRLGKTTTLGEVRLQSKTLEMSEIVVSGERPLIDPSSTTIGSNLDINTIETLPVERNFRSMVSLAPQANASYFGDEANISGSTGIENVYFIDGINVTDPHKVKTSTNLPYNFIKEIEIKTGGYEAEYQSALGGIVNVITHSGSNEFHGQAFGFFTNQTFTSDRKLGSVESDANSFSQSDYGINLGGPILKDRLWFFMAYNPQFEEEEIEIPNEGFHRDNKTAHIFAGKLTWQASENTNFIFSIFGDPNFRNRIGPSIGGMVPVSVKNLDPLLCRLEEGGINISLAGRHIINSNLLLEADISRYERTDKNLPRTAIGRNESLLIDLTTGAWSGGYGQLIDTQSERTSFKLKTTFFLKNHEIKTGVEYVENVTDQDHSWSVGVGGIIFMMSDTLYQSYSSAIVGKVRNRIPAVFAQDSWQLSNRLKLNLGIRWTGQFFYGSDGKRAQTIKNQYQPRLGFIFQPGKLGSQKIFGSYGRFFERMATHPLLNSFTSRTELITQYDHNPLLDPSGGQVTDLSIAILPEVKGLKGQYFDEFILGYEHIFTQRFKLGVRGIYRNLGEVMEDILHPEKGFIFGNPGIGDLSELPKFTRKYTALEFTIEKFNSEIFNFMASYVLSRNYGNYGGLYDTETGLGELPNTSRTLDLVEQIPNSTGWLPNDRTHVFKFFGSYYLNFGLNIGASFLWQSGTPLTEYGGSSFGPPFNTFISKRGSAGRTPSIWDLNIRVSYNMSKIIKTPLKPKLILDLFHVASKKTDVNYDQTHYSIIDEDGNHIGENPNYLKPIAFLPPMSLRLGIEVGF